MVSTMLPDPEDSCNGLDVDVRLDDSLNTGSVGTLDEEGHVLRVGKDRNRNASWENRSNVNSTSAKVRLRSALDNDSTPLFARAVSWEVGSLL